MPNTLTKGIELLRDVPGVGPAAAKGCRVVYNARFFLRNGDEVSLDAQSIAAYPGHHRTRRMDDVELIDHITTLGKRQSIAAVEKSLFGMQVSAYREVLASTQLCYGARGIEGLIPANAMLRIQLWVHDLQPTNKTPSPR